MDESFNDAFEITHQTQIIEFQGESVCSIIDDDPKNKSVYERFLKSGYDYNLKGVILKNPKGHQLACRYSLKDDTGYLDYKIAPTNQWISQLRRSKKLAIANTVGITLMIGQDLWTGDIDDVLQRFYSPSQD